GAGPVGGYLARAAQPQRRPRGPPRLADRDRRVRRGERLRRRYRFARHRPRFDAQRHRGAVQRRPEVLGDRAPQAPLDKRSIDVLAVLPWLQPLTWLLQVMPVFFLVGGFSHATALASVHRRGGGYTDFVRSRAGRLLRPTAVFVGGWLALALGLELTGHDRGV